MPRVCHLSGWPVPGLVLYLLAATALAQDVPAGESNTFILGSYGRAQASTDLSGGRGEPTNLVAFGPRLEADPYAEIDLGWLHTLEDGARFRALITPAISGEPFHYDGDWDADLAVRNLFAEGFLPAGSGEVNVWAGSRMYRGDDIYLLNFWPLDMLNTYGGGAGFTHERAAVAAHVGFNRIDRDDWQVQRWERPVPGGVGEDAVVILDRQRRIASLKAHGTLPVGDITLRAKVYGELHSLPEGTRLIDDQVEEALPADSGSVMGAQLSAWGWADESFVHLFYRRATGLGAYGELAVPSDGFATDYTVTAAREQRVALAFGHEFQERVSLAGGAYVRQYADADGLAVDVDDGWESAMALRPAVNFGQHVSLGVEASHQWLRPNGLNPRTDEHDIPQITKISVLPMVKPRPRTFSRPMIHLTYTASMLNEDALQWFDPLDERAQSDVQHFVGLGAEWWMNSQSYR